MRARACTETLIVSRKILCIEYKKKTYNSAILHNVSILYC